MQNTTNNSNEIINISEQMNYIDMPEVDLLPPMTYAEVVATISNLTTIMAMSNAGQGVA